MHVRPTCLLFATILIQAVSLDAAVIGTNSPSLPLTLARITTLDAERRSSWAAYLERSEKLRAADRTSLDAELKSAGLQAPLVPSKGATIPLTQRA